MTSLDDFPFHPPVEDDWPPAPVIEREPRKCKRHRWTPGMVELDEIGLVCRLCGKPKDEAVSRRGKAARNRGNAFEREVAAKLGGVRKGQYGDKVDVEVPGWLRVQCKNGAGYPERIDGWLRAIPFQADLLRAVVLGDAPGPGNRRRILIAFDIDEFASWYANGWLHPGDPGYPYSEVDS